MEGRQMKKVRRRGGGTTNVAAVPPRSPVPPTGLPSSTPDASAELSADSSTSTATTAELLFGVEPAAQVYITGGSTRLVPRRAQNLMGRVRQVVCSSNHAWYLLENGSCYAERPSGARLLTIEDKKVKQVACAGSHAVLIYDDGKPMWTKVDSPHPRLQEFTAPLEITPVKEIACTDTHALFLFETGVVHEVPFAPSTDVKDMVRFTPESGVLHIAGSHNAFVALTGNGDVYTWYPSKPDLVKVPGLENKGVKEIACGTYHYAAITHDGQLYTWGSNLLHQLGHNDGQKTCPHPKRVDALHGKPITSVSCGASHTACVTEMGRVYSWGIGTSGALGHGDTVDQTAPQLIEELKHVTVSHIACGWYHTIAVVSMGVGPNQARLAKDISSLLTGGDTFSDTTVYGREATKGISAHKIILSRLPAWERKLLATEPGQTNGLSELRVDIEERLLKYLLGFLYGQPLPSDLSVDLYLDLLLLAKKILFRALYEASIASFGFGTNADNVCRLWKELRASASKRTNASREGVVNLSEADMMSFYNHCFVVIILNMERLWNSVDFREIASEVRGMSRKIDSMMKEKESEHSKQTSNPFGALPAEVKAEAKEKETPNSEQNPSEVKPTTDVTVESVENKAEGSTSTVETEKDASLSDPPADVEDETSSQWGDASRCDTLTSTLSRFIASEKFSDVTLSVEGHMIPAHKAILCSRSSHFRAMFTLGMKEATSSIIEVSDMSYEVLMAILRYLYAAEADITEENVVELMISANQYVLLPLQEQCEVFVEQGLSIDNAGYFLEMANRFQTQHLKTLAFNYLIQHRAEFEENEEAQEHLSPELMAEYRRKVACADKCLLAGSGLSWAPVQERATFSIHICNGEGTVLEKGGEQFDVRIFPIDVPSLKPDATPGGTSSDSLADLLSQLRSQGYFNGTIVEYNQMGRPTGEYIVHYSVPYEGTYQVHISLYGKPVNGSPFTIWSGAPYSANKSAIREEGLEPLVAGVERILTIDARDSNGNKCRGGGREWDISISGEFLYQVSTEDHGDGTYTFPLFLRKAGEYEMGVALKPEPVAYFSFTTSSMPNQTTFIKDSPYTLKCIAGQPFAARCRIEGGAAFAYDVNKTLKILTRDRWENDVEKLVALDKTKYQVVIRPERPGEAARVQQRRELLDRLYKAEDELFDSERHLNLFHIKERNLSKQQNLAGLVLYRQKKKEASKKKAVSDSTPETVLSDKELELKEKTEAEIKAKRETINELKMLDNALTQDEAWLQDNSEESMRSSDDVELTVSRVGLGHQLQFVIKKPDGDVSEGKFTPDGACISTYVVIVKLDGQHIGNSPFRLMRSSSSIALTDASSTSFGDASFSFASTPFRFGSGESSASSPSQKSEDVSIVSAAFLDKLMPTTRGRRSRGDRRSASGATENSTPVSFSPSFTPSADVSPSTTAPPLFPSFTLPDSVVATPASPTTAVGTPFSFTATSTTSTPTAFTAPSSPSPSTSAPPSPFSFSFQASSKKEE